MNTTTIATAVAILGLGATGYAGEVASGKSPKSPKAPPPVALEAGCESFNAGTFGASFYGAAILPDGNDFDDALGGGLAFNYFFTKHLGAEVSGTWLATDSTLHDISGSVVARFPIDSVCIAPYIFAGGGVETDSVTQGTWHAGGGIDIRLGHAPLSPGVFADARYTWAEETDNYVLIRAGLRINL